MIRAIYHIEIYLEIIKRLRTGDITFQELKSHLTKGKKGTVDNFLIVLHSMQQSELLSIVYKDRNNGIKEENIDYITLRRI